jgi:hypothetical protein
MENRKNLYSSGLYTLNTTPQGQVGQVLTYQGANKLSLWKNIKPYKVYTAILTQTSTFAPVASILQNELGEITFSVLSEGEYNVESIEGSFTPNKTAILIGNTNSS